jgi:hypothetical protein
MRRREFLSLLGGATAAWPLAAPAQQPDRMRRIMYMHALAENDPEEQLRIAAFRQGLETLGWTARAVIFKSSIGIPAAISPASRLTRLNW